MFAARARQHLSTHSRWHSRSCLHSRHARWCSSASRGFSSAAARCRHDGPLSGLLFLDCGQFLAGPVVTLYAAALGARVVKVEKPCTGDDARDIGPHCPESGESSYFMSVNRGKESLTLDLRSPKGKNIFRKLASKSDVLVENFRPGVMGRLDLDYDSLLADPTNDCSHLIYASNSGFGQEGPDAKRPAFDSLLQAAGGLISVTGHSDSAGEGAGASDKAYCRVGVSVVDYVSGMNTLIGILAALYQRSASGAAGSGSSEGRGAGMRVNISMLASTVALMENQVARHSITGHVPVPEGLAHPVVCPFNAYSTRDGLIYIAISNNRVFRVLCDALDRPDLQEDPRFLLSEDRMQHKQELEGILNGILSSQTTEEWETQLVPAGVPASAVCDVEEVKSRYPGAFVSVEHPTAGTHLFSGSPMRFSLGSAGAGGPALGVDAGADFARPAPTLGQHTDDILAGDLALSPDVINSLKSEGVV